MTPVIPLTGQTYRHKKTGRLYRVLFADARIEAGNVEAVIYQRVGETGGAPWVRPYTEFCDGRFEHVTAAERLAAIGND